MRIKETISRFQTEIYFGIIAVCLLIFGVFIWNITPTGVSNLPEPLDMFEKSVNDMAVFNLRDYVYWYRANIAMQSILIVAALLATVFAAVTTKENAEQMKKFSIFLTAITSALTVVFSTFHVRENIESFIKANTSLLELRLKYLDDRKNFDKDLQQQKNANKNVIPQGPVEIQKKYIKTYSDIMSVRMRAWSNVGQQALPNSIKTTNDQVLGDPNLPTGTEKQR